jgi:hypothetical protein
MNTPIYRFRAHRAQKLILCSPYRFQVVAAGRRFGKTELAKWIGLNTAQAGKQCWWLTPTYLTAWSVWENLKQTAHQLKNAKVKESERAVVFDHGGTLMIRSTHSPHHLRGAGLDQVILDEAAFMDAVVWTEVVRPMLLDRGGGALLLSTPKGRNWFWEVFKQGLDPEMSDWASYHFTSYHNPLLPKHEIDQLRLSTPERVFKEEYLAQFQDMEGQVFRRVYDVATAPNPVQPIASHRYSAGIDWGRDHDFTAIAIFDADTAQLVALDRFNLIGWEQQRARIKALIDYWNPSVIWAESNSIGSVNLEALQNEGLPLRAFQTTAHSKAPLIEAFALAIERGELSLLSDAVLLGELLSYRMERLWGGGYRFTAPPDGHDDTVIATALAWHGVRYSGAGVSLL